MPRPKPELADVFRRYGEAYRQNFGALLSTAQRRVMTVIELCRTAALGGHVEVCDRCGHQRIWFNSCPSLSKVPVLGTRRMDRKPTIRISPNSVFSRCIYATRKDRRHRLTEHA